MTKLPLFEAHDGGKVSATVRTSSLIFCCKSGVKYSGFISCHFWHVLQPLLHDLIFCISFNQQPRSYKTFRSYSFRIVNKVIIKQNN